MILSNFLEVLKKERVFYNDMYKVQKKIEESFNHQSYFEYLGLNEGSNLLTKQYDLMNKEMNLIQFYIKDSLIIMLRKKSLIKIFRTIKSK